MDYSLSGNSLVRWIYDRSRYGLKVFSGLLTTLCFRKGDAAPPSYSPVEFLE